MRPMFDGGVKPSRYCNMVAELHHKEHMRLALLYKYSDQGLLTPTNEMFSTFYDKGKYNGFVPDSTYFNKCY